MDPTGYQTKAQGESEIMKSATFLIVNRRAYVCPLVYVFSCIVILQSSMARTYKPPL